MGVWSKRNRTWRHGKQSKGPLRRIVEVNPRGQFMTPMERLECGHWQPAKQDLVGVTHAERRRCRSCHSGVVRYGPDGALPTPTDEEAKR